MNLRELFVTDENEYVEIKKIVSRIFHLERELPDQVFQAGYDGFRFGEYNSIFEEDFWNKIKILARIAGDSYIILMELENSYNKKMKWYECAKLPVSLSYEDYLDIFQIEDDDHGKLGLIHYGFYFIFASPSAQWGIWVEKDIEMYVFSCKENVKRKLADVRLSHTFSLRDAIDYMHSIYVDPQKLNEFCEQLLENYKTVDEHFESQ